MKRLKIVLQHRYIYFLLIVVSVSSIIVKTRIIKYDSIHSLSDNYFIGKIIDVNYMDDYVSFTLKEKEKILCRYYYDDINKVQNDLLIGSTVALTGELIIPSENTNPNQFNYKKYLYNKRIYRIINVNKYRIITEKKNIFYSIKNSLNSNLNEDNKVNSYIKTFVIGKNEIDYDIKESYRSMGISHLFAISGMHIMLIIGNFNKLIDKFLSHKTSKLLILLLLLLFYMFLTGFTASVLRSGISFIINKINKMYKIKLSKYKLIILTISILVIMNPFIIYDVGFLFSVVLSSYLRIFSKLINSQKYYLKKLIVISFISFVSSFPIVIYNFYEINILSVFYNIITVPLVTFIIFPLSVLCLIFKPLKNLLSFFIYNLENLANFSNRINTSLIFGRPSIFLIIIYYVFITMLLIGILKKKTYLILPLLFLIVFHYNRNALFQSKFVFFADVGQGDSILINDGSSAVLIDTGGLYYKKESNISLDILKSLGIKRIKKIIITHGDYDHMGEAINLVNNIKIEKVIFNCGPYNDLEKELIKVLDKKKIKYYSCIKELNIDKSKLYFLQTKEYDNENDNSNVIYTELNGYKFMFMGDASSTTEKEILNKYNLPNIDVLKVGHHGSKTSSSKEFIDEINPKYSIISVGKNNRYGHPNKEVLDNLENSKIYRTDESGSIMFKIKNNKLEIETCSP